MQSEPEFSVEVSEDCARIVMGGELCGASATQLVSALLSMGEGIEGWDGVTLHLVQCVGGEIESALAIVDAIKAVSAPVTVVGWGTVASAAVAILARGDKRELMPHARVMLHRASHYSGAGKGAEETEAAVRQCIRDELAMFDVIEGAAGKPPGFFLHRVRNCGELWLTAHEAVAEGLADRVIA